MPSPVSTFLAAAILVLALILGVAYTYETSRPHTDVVNETWTPDAGNVTQLDDSELADTTYDTNVTVRNSSDVVMENETDYEWIPSNGTIKTITGGDLDGESSANITYGYDSPTDFQQNQLSVWVELSAVARLLLWIFVPLMFLWGLMAAFGGFG